MFEYILLQWVESHQQILASEALPGQDIFYDVRIFVTRTFLSVKPGVKTVERLLQLPSPSMMPSRVNAQPFTKLPKEVTDKVAGKNMYIKLISSSLLTCGGNLCANLCYNNLKVI